MEILTPFPAMSLLGSGPSAQSLTSYRSTTLCQRSGAASLPHVGRGGGECVSSYCWTTTTAHVRPVKSQVTGSRYWTLLPLMADTRGKFEVCSSQRALFTPARATQFSLTVRAVAVCGGR